MTRASEPAVVEVFLGLGSNQQPEMHIGAGIDALQKAFTDVRISPVYLSAAVGFDGRDFLNCAAAIHTAMPLAALKQWLIKLEDRYGRDRSQPKFSDRSLDIDILLYDDLTGTFNGLELPRDEILKYAHVLKPLADLAPDLQHPVTAQTYSEHWAAFSGDRSLEPVTLDKAGDVKRLRPP